MRLRQRAQPESSASNVAGGLVQPELLTKGQTRRTSRARSCRASWACTAAGSRWKNRRKRDGARTGGAAPPALGQRRLGAGTVTHVRARSTPAAPCAHSHCIPLLDSPQAHFSAKAQLTNASTGSALRMGMEASRTKVSQGFNVSHALSSATAVALLSNCNPRGAAKLAASLLQKKNSPAQKLNKVPILSPSPAPTFEALRPALLLP